MKSSASKCAYRRGELIASSNPVEEIRNFVEADSLAYLSREGMYVFLNGKTGGFSDAYLSGNYPLHFDDEGKAKQLHLFEAVQQR